MGARLGGRLGTTVLGAVLGSGSSTALAEPAHAAGSVEFVWDAPAAGCPAEPEVVAELERLLGGPVQAQGRGRLAAIARIRREPDGRWDLRLWTVTADATRHRSMQGDNCHVLADAAALLAAMAIDPDVLSRATASTAAVDKAERAQEIEGPPPPEEIAEREATEPEPPPEEPVPGEGEPAEPRGDSAPPRPDDEPTGASSSGPTPRSWLLSVRAQAGLSIADVPAVGPVVRLGLGWQRERLRLELDGHYAFTRKARFEDTPSVGADLRLAMGVLRGCGVITTARAPLEIPVCGGLEVGALLGRGVGFVTVRDGAVPWLALDVAPSLVWVPRPWLAMSLTVEPWVALLRGRMRVDDGTSLWRPFPVGLRAFGGVEVRF